MFVFKIICSTPSESFTSYNFYCEKREWQSGCDCSISNGWYVYLLLPAVTLVVKKGNDMFGLENYIFNTPPQRQISLAAYAAAKWCGYTRWSVSFIKDEFNSKKKEWQRELVSMGLFFLHPETHKDFLSDDLSFFWLSLTTVKLIKVAFITVAFSMDDFITDDFC